MGNKCERSNPDFSVAHLRYNCAHIFFPCAGYLRHLFIKLERCASIISLASHLAFTKRGPHQEDREQASSCSLNTHASLSATKQRDDVFSSSVKRKQGRERSNSLAFWHRHFALPHDVHSPRGNALSRVYAALW